MVVGQLNLEDDNDNDDDDYDPHDNSIENANKMKAMLVKFRIYLMKKEALNLTQPWLSGHNYFVISL